MSYSECVIAAVVETKKRKATEIKTRMAIKIITVRRTTTTARGNDSRGSWCLYRD